MTYTHAHSAGKLFYHKKEHKILILIVRDEGNDKGGGLIHIYLIIPEIAQSIKKI